jgi:hypothetical protein
MLMGLLLVAFAVVVFLLLLPADIEMKNRFAIALIVSWLVSTPLSLSLFRTKGLFRILGLMYLRPHNTIVIDDKIILAETMLTNSGFRNATDLVFVPMTGSFVKGVRIDNRGGHVELFVYPSLFEEFFMNDGELKTLCDRLNKLVSDARALPRVKYDEIRV